MSMRTVIDLSPLLETTIPWRTLAAFDSRSAGGPVLFRRRALFAPQLRLALALGGPFGFPLLGSGSARLPRSARFLQPAALLPGKIVLGVRLRSLLSGRSGLSCLLRRSFSVSLLGLCRG